VKPYAELLEFNQPNPIRKPGFTRIRDSFPGLESWKDSPVSEQRDADPGGQGAFADPERIMEFAGRWDYGEYNARKLGETSKMKVQTNLLHPEKNEVEVPIIRKYLAMGHESMIEMGDATFFIECSRPCSHELCRHRLASFQQESQRFAKVETTGDLDTYYFPDMPDDEQSMPFDLAIQRSIASYQELLDKGVPKQIARYVLPGAMRTRLVMKANAREWRHILKLRTDKSAQPEMRELMLQIHDQLIDIFPNAMHGVLDGERGVR
jgi:flavin-dependent thymidylate synthase